MKKRVLQIVLVLALLLPMSALLEEAAGKFTYTIQADGTASISGFQGSSEHLEIPGQIDGLRVSAIGSAAFYGREDIKSIVIPDGVTRIGKAAFKNARQLTSLTLPAGLMEIGESAFENCFSLERLAIPAGITRIPDRTFQNCKALTSLTLPEGITEIGIASFSGLDSLKELNLPGTLRTIGMGAFAVSHGLEQIVLPASVEELGYSAFHGSRNLKSIVLSTGLKKIGGGMFYDCPSLESVAFPESIRSIDTSMLFTGSDKAGILGFAGSSAQTLSRSLRLPFQEISPVREITLTNEQGVSVANQMVGIDLAGEVKTLQLNAGLTQQTSWPAIRWESSIPDVAAVNQAGLITALKSGSSVISASATDGSGYSVRMDVNVAILAKEIIVSGEESLTAGAKTNLTAAVYPENADNRTVVWTSSDEAAATIDKNGRVTANKVGAAATVEFTARVMDGSGVAGRHLITIYPVAREVILFTDGVQVPAKTLLGMDFGSDNLSLQLEGKVLPQDAKQQVTYHSSAPRVVEVSETGLLTALKKGSANITIQAADGTRVKGTWKVNVATMVRELTIMGERELVSGKSTVLKTEAFPPDADNKKVEWSSSDPGAATVSNGKVSANRKLGQATSVTITATARDGSGVFSTHTLTVYPAAKSVVLFSDNVELNAKSRLGIDINAQNPAIQLTASTLPEGALQDVSWRSSHPRYAAVDENGLVTGVARGEATITATALDGSGRRMSVKVKVSVHAQGLTITSASPTLKPRESVRLRAAFLPEDVDSKSLEWTSSDENLATVDQRGTVTAKRNVGPGGEVVITAVTKDGSNISSSVTLQVVP